MTAITDTDTNPFRYSGEYFDKETGFIYLRNRYYEPEAGRFINEDPIKDGGNWYVYAGNNPVMFVDPSGLDAVWLNGSNMTEFGHSSLLVEYKGDWYYFFYGEDMAVLHKIEPQKTGTYKGNFDVQNALESLDKLTLYFSKVSTRVHHNYPYDSATYIQGDFSKTYEFLAKLPYITGSKGNQNPDYNAFTNNCAQKCLEAIKLASLNDGNSVEGLYEEL